MLTHPRPANLKKPTRQVTSATMADPQLDVLSRCESAECSCKATHLLGESVTMCEAPSLSAIFTPAGRRHVVSSNNR